MNRDVRRITDGAMMAAIIGAALVINRQTAGLLVGMVLWAFPLPMVFYGAKYGWKSSWMLFAAVLALTFILSTPQTLFYVASEAFIGMFYGCGIYHKMPTGRLLFGTLAMAVICDVLSMLVFASFFGYDLAAEVTEYETLFNNVYSQTGQSLSDTLNLTSVIKTMMVVSTVVTGLMEGFITHVLSRILLKRLRFNVEPLKPLGASVPPKWTGYAGIILVFMYMYSMSGQFDNATLQYSLMGIGICGVFYLLLYGFIAMLLFLARAVRSRGLAVLLAVFMCLAGMMIVVMLGFLYITTTLHERLSGGYNNASEN